MKTREFCSLAASMVAACLLFVSCDKSEKEVFVSEIGQWEYSSSEYYYDGQRLDYDGNVIGIWKSESDVSYMVSHGKLSFNDNGTGLLLGMGEFESDEYAYTYTRTGNKLSLRIPIKGEQVIREMDIQKGKLTMEYTVDDVYGWSEDKADNARGADGNTTHKLKLVDYYIQKQK